MADKIPQGYQATYAKNSNGTSTLVMVTSEKDINSKKEKPKMANKPQANKPKDENNNKNFKPTFRKYADMTDGEKEAFRQGAKTNENKIKERLGMLPPRDQ